MSATSFLSYLKNDVGVYCLLDAVTLPEIQSILVYMSYVLNMEDRDIADVLCLSQAEMAKQLSDGLGVMHKMYLKMGERSD